MSYQLLQLALYILGRTRSIGSEAQVECKRRRDPDATFLIVELSNLNKKNSQHVSVPPSPWTALQGQVCGVLQHLDAGEVVASIVNRRSLNRRVWGGGGVRPLVSWSQRIGLLSP